LLVFIIDAHARLPSFASAWATTQLVPKFVQVDFQIIIPNPRLTGLPDFFHKGTRLIGSHLLRLNVVRPHEAIEMLLYSFVIELVRFAPAMTFGMERTSSSLLKNLPRLGTKR
jgi:hypothetical protein